MKPKVFITLSLIAGLGVFFLDPLPGFVTFIVPACAILLAQWFDQRYGENQVMSSDSHMIESLPPTKSLSQRFNMESPHQQIARLNSFEIPDLLRTLPYDTWHRRSFHQHGDAWRFEFEGNSTDRRFVASGIGETPERAFMTAKKSLMAQLDDWHVARFPENAPVVEKKPRVLIVDDDVDLAFAMQTALAQLGCETEIATRHEDLHRKITFSNADYILMDWKLNDNVTADVVLNKASRLINTFSDLREKFVEHRPRIVTYSALDKEDIQIPQTEFFDFLDHVQKPITLPKAVERMSGLMALH